MIGLLSLPNRPVQAMLHEYEGYGPEQLQLLRDQPCQRKPLGCCHRKEDGSVKNCRQAPA